VKITTLLAQYLYTNKRLDLTGIGSFTLDPSAIVVSEGNKQRSAVLEGISFESNPLQKESPDLINFISVTAGKMKALAASDIDSYLQLVHQFLNIGKPFTFDGIGTIVKLKGGGFDFIPGVALPEKLKDAVRAESSTNSGKEESTKKYDSFLNKSNNTTSWRKPVAAVLIVCGIGLAIWGGYIISKKKAPDTVAAATQPTVEPAVQAPLPIDSTQLKENQPQVEDSQEITTASEPLNTTVAAADSYKYVLEVANGKRAFQRYNQLRTNLWEVKLETKDSLQYKLYMLLPALNSDTTRILDSLTVMTGKRVYIEYQN
jgi:hypothetical protein